MPRLLGVVWALVCIGCATGGTPDAVPVYFSAVPAPHTGERFPNWSAPPDRLEPLLESAPAEVRGLEAGQCESWRSDARQASGRDGPHG